MKPPSRSRECGFSLFATPTLPKSEFPAAFSESIALSLATPFSGFRSGSRSQGLTLTERYRNDYDAAHDGDVDNDDYAMCAIAQNLSQHIP